MHLHDELGKQSGIYVVVVLANLNFEAMFLPLLTGSLAYISGLYILYRYLTIIPKNKTHLMIRKFRGFKRRFILTVGNIYVT